MNEKIKSYKKQILILLSLTIIITSIIIDINIIKPNKKYKEAIQLFEEDKLEKANTIFKELGDYKESEKYLEKINEEINFQIYKDAFNYYVDGEFENAETLFNQIVDYEDVKEYLQNILQLQKYKGTWKEIGGYGNWLIFDGWTVYEIINPNDLSQTTFEDKYTLDKDGEQLTVSFPSSNVKYYIKNGKLFRERVYPDETVTSKFNRMSSSTEMPGLKKPQIGMTAEEVRNSTWGEPKKINKTTTKYGVSEQWVYYGYKYIYLENDIVTAIQE
mgnify:CR=1 FL=1